MTRIEQNIQTCGLVTELTNSQTIFEIYKVIIPKSKIIVENHTKSGFIHFEKYDSRFQWNKPTSVIEIWLPLNTNK